jgi:hypothetical protein
MNERIKELMVKASSGACYDEDTPALYGNEPVNEIEEFAKLIVRECMEWCDAHATIDGTAQQVRNSIKNHFGVE